MIGRIKTFLVDSNLFVALGVWSLVKLTGLLHNIDVDFFAIFSLFSTLLVYSFSLLFSHGKSSGFKKLFFSSKMLVHKFVFLLSASVLPFFLIQFDSYMLLGLIPVAIVSFLYPVEIIREEQRKVTLREFPYLKIFLIGISWGVVTVLLPMLFAKEELLMSDYFEALVRAMFVIAITIPFDVRDVKSDSPDMKTIPQKFGVARAKILSYILLAFNFIYYLWLDKVGVETSVFIFITLLFTSLLVLFSNSNKPKFYYTVLIESTSLLLFLSFYIS